MRRFVTLATSFICFLFITVLLLESSYPSYTSRPKHYLELEHRIKTSTSSGAGNPAKEKIFIAANLRDPNGLLARGDWAKNVLDLISLLGPENVYLSIFQNDSGESAVEALAELESKVVCNHTLKAIRHLDLDSLPRVTLPDGARRIPRIAYLASVRNQALLPLDTTGTTFDRILFINDVIFNPTQAAQLLFSTNHDSTGYANYRAACAVDFINIFKFYDTFATRDLDGYGMGVPFFPWFSASGSRSSLRDVLKGSDAVRVRSCWGGMIAFDATFLQQQKDPSTIPRTAAAQSPSNITAPYRFRHESELWWDASECCLINADIQNPEAQNTEIYMNPYVRVAYDTRTLQWLALTCRFEKLWLISHFIANAIGGLPRFNPRQRETPGQHVDEFAFTNDKNNTSEIAYRKHVRIATHAGFCGTKMLQVMVEDVKRRGGNWESVEPPYIEGN